MRLSRPAARRLMNMNHRVMGAIDLLVIAINYAGRFATKE